MTRPKLPDMSKCTPKKKCCGGYYEGTPYDPADPCETGFYLNNDCTCIKCDTVANCPDYEYEGYIAITSYWDRYVEEFRCMVNEGCDGRRSRGPKYLDTNVYTLTVKHEDWLKAYDVSGNPAYDNPTRLPCEDYVMMRVQGRTMEVNKIVSGMKIFYTTPDDTCPGAAKMDCTGHCSSYDGVFGQTWSLEYYYINSTITFLDEDPWWAEG